MYQGPNNPDGDYNAGLPRPVIGVGFGLPGIIVAILGIVSLFNMFNIALINIPPLTLLGFQIWRIFTCIVSTPDIISALFTLLMLFFISASEEQKVGSSRLILSMYYRNIVIQLGVTFIGILITSATGLMTFSYGIFPVIMVIITMRCLEDPEGDRDCCCGIMIKNKNYPIVLLVIFFILELMASSFALDMLLGYLLGYWMHINPSVQHSIDPSYATILWFESFLKPLDGRLGTFISESEAGAVTAQAANPLNPMGMFAAMRPNNQPQQTNVGGGRVYQQQGGAPPSQQQRAYFSGQGVQIGSNDYPVPQEMNQLPPGFENGGRPPYNQPAARYNEYNRQ